MIDWDRLVLAPCEAAFGEHVIYLANDGRVIAGTPEDPLRGVYNDRFAVTKFENDQEVHTAHPMVSIRASRVPKPPVQTEFFRIRGLLYAVTEVEADGMGDLRIHLRAATNEEARRAPRPL